MSAFEFPKSQGGVPVIYYVTPEGELRLGPEFEYEVRRVVREEIAAAREEAREAAPLPPAPR